METQFPQYEFRLGKRIYGKCIIAKNTKYSGADIFIKSDRITLEAAVPDMKTRLMIGGGAVFLKMFRKNYSEPSLKIYAYLKDNGYKVKLKE